MCVQNLKCVALPVPEIIGGIQGLSKFLGYMGIPKIWTVPGDVESLDTRPTLIPFLQNFKWAFVRMDPVNVGLPTKSEVRSFSALPVPEIIAIEVLGEGNCEPILGIEALGGRGFTVDPKERW